MSRDFDSDSAFRAGVSNVLHLLIDQIDEIDSDEHDVQLAEGNLKTVFETGETYILSQQTPLHEIWLSAELKAWHFSRTNGDWVERDSSEPMFQVLSTLFSAKLGMDIRFEP